MAIKNVTFSFDVPITTLLGLIATGNAAMRVDVFGDNKPPKKLLNGHAPKLLEGPKRTRRNGADASGRPMTANQGMLLALADLPEKKATMKELRTVVTALGLNPISANSQIAVMRQNGLTKKVGKGVYQLTAKGAAKAAELRKQTEQAHG